MKILPFSEVRAKLGELLDQVEAGDEEIVIARNGNLKVEISGLWNLQVGRFRVIYCVAGKTLTVVAIGPSASIYRNIP